MRTILTFIAIALLSAVATAQAAQDGQSHWLRQQLQMTDGSPQPVSAAAKQTKAGAQGRSGAVEQKMERARAPDVDAWLTRELRQTDGSGR